MFDYLESAEYTPAQQAAHRQVLTETTPSGLHAGMDLSAQLAGRMIGALLVMIVFAVGSLSICYYVGLPYSEPLTMGISAAALFVMAVTFIALMWNES